MKVLLTVPLNRSYVIMPPLGLGYIASVVRNKGHDVEILHGIKDNITPEKLKNLQMKKRFDVIGFQMMTYDFNPIKKLSKAIKEINHETIVVVGGAHPSGDPQGTLNSIKEIDYAFIGEVEIAFPYFLEKIKKVNEKNRSKILGSVPNLVWRNKDKVIVNPWKFVDDLDSFDFPAWDLMDPREYPEAPHGAFLKSYPYAPIIITRGCPFQCSFCAGKCVTDNRIGKRSIKNVIKEMEYLMNKYGVKEFMIEDENFTLHKNLVYEFCNEIIKRRWRVHWSCPAGVRLDTLDLRMLKLMEKSGCHSLSVGIEFGSQKILNLTKKRLSIKIIKEKIDLINKTGIRISGFFMMGYPGETKKDIWKTIKLAWSLPIDRAQFNNFMPLPGSEIYNKLKGEGKLKNLRVDHFFVHDVGFIPEGFTEKELKNLQRKAYIGFYLKPRIIIGLLKDITTLQQFKYLIDRFFDALK